MALFTDIIELQPQKTSAVLHKSCAEEKTEGENSPEKKKWPAVARFASDDEQLCASRLGRKEKKKAFQTVVSVIFLCLC